MPLTQNVKDCLVAIKSVKSQLKTVISSPVVDMKEYVRVMENLIGLYRCLEGELEREDEVHALQRRKE